VTTTKPIEDYAVIGDMHTAALVGRDGAIDWLCLPHFDDHALFAALLHDSSAGHWTIAPDAGGPSTSRHYEDDTLVLRTRWQTDDGVVEVIDFMPPRGEAADVVRIVEGVRGSVAMATRMRLRFDYGRVRPWIRPGDEPAGTAAAARAEQRDDPPARGTHVLSAIAGPDAIWVHADVPLHLEGDELSASFTVAHGQRVAFVLTHRPSYLPQPEAAHPARALEHTRRSWKSWMSCCNYQGRWKAEVHRSLLLLKALTFAPTGGIVAAATTSLPEEIGGVRNWDYRYCWLRDATFTLQALLGTGYVDEASAWREWLVRAVAGDPAKLQIMYGLDGTQRLPELTLDWLEGYEGSRPVRVGNAAADQHQLDVWGETLDGLYLAREAGLRVTDSAWDLQRALLDWLSDHWHEPDNGLWEMRGPRRHFVHSKVMAWAGLDRAVRTVEEHRLEGDVDAWRDLAGRIHADVCTHGYDPQRNTFTQFYGSSGLDAALLLIPRVGFLPWEDERVVGTVEAVARELDRDGFLLRYDTNADGGPDGLPGDEGAFLACSFWLVDALHGIGQRDRAEDLFERLLSLRNDVGMLAEEYDPSTGRHLGNTPQAFSLVGLVNSARHLSDTRSSNSRDTCS
jgi:GH15 family glucan-1,4-alpha-glucosidase